MSQTKWHQIKFEKLFENVKEAVLTAASAALENCFQNETGGFTRFPGLKDFVTLSGNAPVYLHDWKGDLVSVTNGLIYRIDSSGNKSNVTGVPVQGGNRVIFDKTEDELVMAAGGQIVRLAAATSEVLSEDAPLSTHVGFIDNYLVAIEKDSGRFQHSLAGQYNQWDALDVFSADGKPDNLNCLLITPYRELLLGGQDSIEQFERLPSGDTPFFRRWSVGEGIKCPYTSVPADNGTWFINKMQEFVRASGQVSEPASDDIGRTFEGVDDFTAAWAVLMHIAGQKFILLQLPYATNAYGTRGITTIFDYRQRRWFNLYGWDNELDRPNRWPGWSYYNLWGRHFVGGEGKIHELDTATYANGGVTQRMLIRTAHLDGWGESRVDNIRIRVKRGVAGSNDTEPVISIRARRDNKNWTRWKQKGFGLAGKREMVVEFGPYGCAHTWQFEAQVTDACEVELVKLEAQVTPIGE